MRRQRKRQGSITVFSLMIMVALCLMVALAVDVGYLTVCRTELQRAADSAALAAVFELLDDRRLEENNTNALNLTEASAREEGRRFFQLNRLSGGTFELVDNASNSANGEIVIGEYQDFSNQNEQLSFADRRRFNAVFVRKQVTVPLFFGRAAGVTEASLTRAAAAGVMPGVSGFRLNDQGPLPLLPITLKRTYWSLYLADQVGTDRYSIDSAGAVIEQPDGIREIVLYPNGTTAGNFGTVDIGDNNNSTADIIRQIRDGLSPADLAPFGGELKLGANGELSLQGDTGISAAIKSALNSILGKRRMIPLYSTVTGQGNNTNYTIVGFAGIRIMHVRLTGGQKGVVIQKSNVASKYAIVDPNLSLSNDLVYTTPRIVR